MFEGVDTVVLHEELAYHDELPVLWQPQSELPDPFRLQAIDQTNLSLLQACVVLEEHPLRDKREDMIPLAQELARLDVKLNLVLQLLGAMAHQTQEQASLPVRFNALGASWQPRGALPALQSLGMLRIRLHQALPQTLDLPAQIASYDHEWVNVRFAHMTESTAELMQRLCFLRHRRRVADARKSRAAD